MARERTTRRIETLSRSAAFITLLSLVWLTNLTSSAIAVDDARLRQDVLQSIQLGRQFVISQQSKDGSWSLDAALSHSDFKAGTTGLAILTLLNLGSKEDDPAVAKGLKYLRDLRIEDLEASASQRPYEISLVLQALAAAKNKDRVKIGRLADLLVAYQKSNGGWKYDRPRGPGDTLFDNSVNQFALLGLREAAMTGHAVDPQVWRNAQELFLQSQVGNLESPSGAGWSYDSKEKAAYGSMTVAGLASLNITSSMLQLDENVGEDGRIDCCAPTGDPRVRKSLKAGERWMASHFSVVDHPAGPRHFYLYYLYYLYGLERAGRLGGIRFFGGYDWYRAGAEQLVRTQNRRTGAWAPGAGAAYAVVDTCFALLFLSKGLAPVVVNKLEYGARDADGRVTSEDWNRHPRDVANLIDSLTTRSGWPQFLNWQTVDLERAANGEGVAALLQAPVQFLSGTHDLTSIQGKQVELLREYVNQGGFILAVQNCTDTDFDAGISTLIGRMFPEGGVELKKLPTTHDIYRSEAVFGPNPPELWGVDFGCRTAIVYAPFDHACRWQKWTKFDVEKRRPDVKSQIAQSMNLGVNVIAYATNRELVSKLDRPPALAAGIDEASRRSAIEIARLRHTGGWDTAPNALRHLQGSLEKLGYLMAATSPNVSATDETLRRYPIAYMHGRKNFEFSQEERNGLRGYVENGGVLIADACCASDQFDKSFRDMIAQTFGKNLERIPLTHELYNMQQLGHDVRKVTRRIPTEQPSGALSNEPSVGEPVLEGIQINGRYVVIYSKYDISCALEQQNTQSCAGYSRLDAAKIAANMVIYALAQ